MTLPSLLPLLLEEEVFLAWIFLSASAALAHIVTMPSPPLQVAPAPSIPLQVTPFPSLAGHALYLSLLSGLAPPPPCEVVPCASLNCCRCPRGRWCHAVPGVCGVSPSIDATASVLVGGAVMPCPLRVAGAFPNVWLVPSLMPCPLRVAGAFPECCHQSLPIACGGWREVGGGGARGGRLG